MQNIRIIKGTFILFEDNTPIRVVSKEFVKQFQENNRKKLINKISKYTLLKLAREIEKTALNIVLSTTQKDIEYYKSLQKLHFEEILRRSN